MRSWGPSPAGRGTRNAPPNGHCVVPGARPEVRLAQRGELRASFWAAINAMIDGPQGAPVVPVERSYAQASSSARRSWTWRVRSRSRCTRWRRDEVARGVSARTLAAVVQALRSRGRIKCRSYRRTPVSPLQLVSFSQAGRIEGWGWSRDGPGPESTQSPLSRRSRTSSLLEPRNSHWSRPRDLESSNRETSYSSEASGRCQRDRRW